MSKFYPLKVKDTKKETRDAISIRFDIPEELKEYFQYKHGQYLTLKLNIRGKEYRRAYSLCSSPALDEDQVVTSKRVQGGVVSNYLNDHLEPGDELEVFPPMGKFTTGLDPSNQRTYVLFAGGSGITPMLSIIKSILHAEPGSMIFLFYGNQDENAIIFRSVLDELKEKNEDRFIIEYVVTHPHNGWKGEAGLLDKYMCLKLMDRYQMEKDDNIEYFICGPVAMMDQVKAALAEKNIPGEKIHIEYFSAPLPHLTKGEEDEEEPEEPDFEEAEVKVILEGEEHVIKVKPDEKILDIAIEEDLDPPFACQMGICTTCKAYLHEGKVEMEENEGLTDQEIGEGYILTCQSHPLTPYLKVEYE